MEGQGVVDLASRPREQMRRRRSHIALRATLAVVALAGMVIILPGVPAAWMGLTHIGDIGDNAQGHVTVKSCRSDDWGLDWTCSGTWSPNDPMATPLPSSTVSVVNDQRHLPKGADLGYVWVDPSTHDAYNAGGRVQLHTLAVWLCLLCCLPVLVLLVVVRPSWAVVASAAGLLGALAFIALSLTTQAVVT